MLNSGSSSLKYQLVEPDTGDIAGARHRRADRRGRRGRRPRGGAAAGVRPAGRGRAGLDSLGLVAVGHRVVHGGQDLYRPTVVDDAVLDQLRELAPLAPLHNPPAVLGIEVARRVLPDLPHVAVFDTAFFHDLPAAAATYAIDRDLAARWQIRRYGFHGTSHQYVSRQAAEFLGVPLESLNQIVLHLGNGASASAIAGGRPVDTSMGMTPMEGLVMGTRVRRHRPRRHQLPVASRGDGRRGHRDHAQPAAPGCSAWRRDRLPGVHQRIESGDEAAQLAYEVYIHRLRKYIGAYLAMLGHTDVITFTAGVGENDARVRRDALSGLAPLGIETRRAPQRQPGARRAADLRGQVADHGAGDPHQRGAGDRAGVPDGASARLCASFCRESDLMPV